MKLVIIFSALLFFKTGYTNCELAAIEVNTFLKEAQDDYVKKKMEFYASLAKREMEDSRVAKVEINNYDAYVPQSKIPTPLRQEKVDEIFGQYQSFSAQQNGSIDLARLHNRDVAESGEGLYAIPSVSDFATKMTKYFKPAERLDRKVIFRTNSKGETILAKRDGSPFSTETGTDVNLSGVVTNTKKGIWVMDTNGNLYIELHPVKGEIHHNSLLRGPVAGAGEIEISAEGKILSINDNSGHYLPPRFITDQAVAKLRSQGVKVPNIEYSDRTPKFLNEPAPKLEHQTVLVDQQYMEKVLSIPREALNLSY